MILLQYYPLALAHTAYHTLLFFQQGPSIFPAAMHRYFTHNAPAVLFFTHLCWHPSAEYCLEPNIFTNDCFHKFIAYCNLYLFFAFLPFPLFGAIVNSPPRWRPKKKVTEIGIFTWFLGSREGGIFQRFLEWRWGEL